MSEPTPLVLVTRSEPGASETATRLRQVGFVPVVESLFAIAPIDVEIPDYDALAFTSDNEVNIESSINAGFHNIQQSVGALDLSKTSNKAAVNLILIE